MVFINENAMFNTNQKEVKIMKKMMVLFLAITFIAGVALVGCGPKKDETAPPATEQATPAPAPAAPAPEAAPAPAAPAAPEAAPAAPAPAK
jgi:hypothetical protein